jgi:hypothetical protein
MKLVLLKFLNKFVTTNLKKKLLNRLALAEKEKESAVKLAEANIRILYKNNSQKRT